MRVLLLAALIPLAGCPAPVETVQVPDTPVGPGPVGPIEGTPAERSPDLDAAKARWQAAGLDAYAMTLRRSCFCPVPDYTGPFEVRVRNGAVEQVRLNGAAVDAERGMTVDALFALVEDAYERGAVEVAVEFDERLGYPTSVGIDYDLRLADEEIGYTVSDLRSAER